MAKAWYVIHTYSGYEQKVKSSLEEQFQHAADVVHHRVDRGEEKAQADGKEDDRDEKHGN